MGATSSRNAVEVWTVFGYGFDRLLNVTAYLLLAHAENLRDQVVSRLKVVVQRGGADIGTRGDFGQSGLCQAPLRKDVSRGQEYPLSCGFGCSDGLAVRSGHGIVYPPLTENS